MLLLSIIIIIMLRSFNGLNKNLNENIFKNFGTNKFEVKMSYIFFTRITAIILILTAIVSAQVFKLSELDEGFSIYNGLLQVNQINLFIEIFVLIIGAIILTTWPGLPFLESSNYHNLDKTNNKIINLINYYQIFLDKSKDYALIILFNLIGAILLISSFDLISLYISIELQSFALYILATFYKESRIVTAAGLKYFILGALSSCFILLGSGLIYAFSGLTKFDSIYCFISSIDSSINYTQLILGMVLIFLGFLFKIGAAPLHNWSPDVYSGVPTIVTVWLTVIPKLSIFILLLELYVHIDLEFIYTSTPLFDYVINNNSHLVPGIVNNFYNLFGGIEKYNELVVTNPGIANIPTDQVKDMTINYIRETNINNVFYVFDNSLDETFTNINSYWNFFLKTLTLKNEGDPALNKLLLISSLLSLIIGTILGLAQSELKRLLAYSTISHLGFILLALSINTQESLDSFLFYIIQYSITNLNVFLIILAFNYLLSSFIKNNIIIKDIKYISELINQFDKNPILTFSFIICLLSMAGRSMPNKFLLNLI